MVKPQSPPNLRTSSGVAGSNSAMRQFFRTRYSDALLAKLLEGRRANIFKNRHEHTGAGGGPIVVTRIENVIVDPARPDDE